jgi:group II intron reverse transcriptase/maturase
MSLTPQTIRIQLQLAKFTKSGRKAWDLYRYLYNPCLLGDALESVLTNDGAAGIDGITTQEIRGKEFQFVSELRDELKSKRYAPHAVKRVFIPKSDGKLRPLGIPRIKDRVVQTALKLLLEPIYEQIFLPCSFGFRPNKKATVCVEEAANFIFKKKRHVLEVDIEAFFDNVSHRKLLGMLKDKIADPRVLRLIAQFLKAGFVENNVFNRSQIGTPQGGPLSPMLANIYLHYGLDKEFARQKAPQKQEAALFRFADDFIIAAANKKLLTRIHKWVVLRLAFIKLKIKESKTRIVNMMNRYRGHQSKFDFLGFKIHLRAFKDNPKRFWVARQPSQKARITLRNSLKQKLTPALSHEQAKTLVDCAWKGWVNYFRFSNANRIFLRETKFIRFVVLYYLRQKYRHNRRPVPWSTLKKIANFITAGIRPPRVIPNQLRQGNPQTGLL